MAVASCAQGLRRMVQAATGVGVTLKEGFEVHGDRVAFDAQSGLWTVKSATVRSKNGSASWISVFISCFVKTHIHRP